MANDPDHLTRRWLVPVLISVIGALCTLGGAVFMHWAGAVEQQIRSLTDEFHDEQQDSRTIRAQRIEQIEQLRREVDSLTIRIGDLERRSRSAQPKDHL